jgi:hypothetical protein
MNIAYLRERLQLDNTSGHLTWQVAAIPGSWNSRHAGKRAGNDKGRGYRMLRVSGVAYLEHRVAYAIATGIDPAEMSVDHINGDRSDNRPCNLRLATNAENIRSRHKLNQNNTSGEHGVHWSSAASKWTAVIKVNRVALYLGLFDNIEDARAARIAAEVIHYGEFSPRNDAMRRETLSQNTINT